MGKKPLLSSIWSTIGRKIVLSLTGLALFLFLVTHLLGNFTLFIKDTSIFNIYADKLASLGPLLYLAEIMLVGAFLIHMFFAIAIVIENKRARGKGYYKTANAGKPSRKTIASATMIYSGIIIAIFLVVHIATFKYGAYYKTTIDGKEVRDLYKLVSELFHNTWYMAGYVVAMIVLGFHLRHAFGSAFQSLGLDHDRYTPTIYNVALLSALVLSIGFLSIPLWIYFH